MYMGVKNHHILPRVTSYETAQKALAVWTAKPRRGRQVTQVLEQDADIAFRLYDTDVVVWHPDNSVTIDNYGSVTTSKFAARFVPEGIRLNFPTSRRGVTAGANTITYRVANGDEGWIGYICQQADAGVRFRLHGDDWLPDESTCYPIELPLGVDRARMHELGKRYHFAEFENWLAVTPHILAIDHEQWDLHICAAALEVRDWVLAAQHLPLIEENNAYGQELKPLPINVWKHDHHVTMTSLARLKQAIWDREGALRTEKRPTWECNAYDRGMTRAKQLEKLGCGRGFGPAV